MRNNSILGRSSGLYITILSKIDKSILENKQLMVCLNEQLLSNYAIPADSVNPNVEMWFLCIFKCFFQEIRLTHRIFHIIVTDFK